MEGTTIGVMCAMGLVACGGGASTSKSVAAVQFPSAESIADVQPVAIQGNAGETVQIDKLEIDPSTLPGPGASPTQTDEALTHAIAPNIQVSAQLSCAARELARIVGVKNATPSTSLRDWTVARCGGSMRGTGFTWLQWKGVGKISDIDLVLKSTAKLGPQIEKWETAGAAVTRDGEDAVVGVVVGSPLADMEPWQAKENDELVWLRGTLKTGAAHVAAAANAGRFGFRHCTRDWSVTLPRFAFRCPMARADAAAWMEIYAIPDKSVLSDVAARVLVVREGANVSYEVGTASTQPAADPATFSAGLVVRVNAVRKEAELFPLDVAPAQAATNTRVTGALINAGLKGEHDTANRLSLALIAGWDVAATIRTGALFASMQPTIDPFAFANVAMEHPMGRMVLLDPQSSQLAVGASFTEKADAAGVVITTYATFAQVNHTIDRARVIQELDGRRIGKGFDPTETITFPEVDAAVHAIELGTAPLQAAKDAMSEAVERLGKSMHVWVLEGTDIERLTFPDDLLYRSVPRVAVAVTHHKVPGAAWGQYVVLLFAVGLPSAMVASGPVRGKLAARVAPP